MYIISIMLCEDFYIVVLFVAERADITPSSILHFLSGSSKLPAAGFDRMPSINFTDESILPKVSTCALSITFPRGYGLKTYPQFKENIDLCILNSFGFGNVSTNLQARTITPVFVLFIMHPLFVKGRLISVIVSS